MRPSVIKTRSPWVRGVVPVMSVRRAYRLRRKRTNGRVPVTRAFDLHVPARHLGIEDLERTTLVAPDEHDLMLPERELGSAGRSFYDDECGQGLVSFEVRDPF